MVTTVAGAAWAAAGKADTKPAARITDAATRCQRPPIPFSLVIEPLLHRRVPQWRPVAAHQIGPGAAPWPQPVRGVAQAAAQSRGADAHDSVVRNRAVPVRQWPQPLSQAACMGCGHVRLHCGSNWATSALPVLDPHRPLWLGSLLN